MSGSGVVHRVLISIKSISRVLCSLARHGSCIILTQNSIVLASWRPFLRLFFHLQSVTAFSTSPNHSASTQPASFRFVHPSVAVSSSPLRNAQRCRPTLQQSSASTARSHWLKSSNTPTCLSLLSNLHQATAPRRPIAVPPLDLLKRLQSLARRDSRPKWPKIAERGLHLKWSILSTQAVGAANQTKPWDGSLL